MLLWLKKTLKVANKFYSKKKTFYLYEKKKAFTH